MGVTDIACFALGETAEPVAAHKTEEGPGHHDRQCRDPAEKFVNNAARTRRVRICAIAQG